MTDSLCLCLQSEYLWVQERCMHQAETFGDACLGIFTVFSTLTYELTYLEIEGIIDYSVMKMIGGSSPNCNNNAPATPFQTLFPNNWRWRSCCSSQVMLLRASVSCCQQDWGWNPSTICFLNSTCRLSFIFVWIDAPLMLMDKQDSKDILYLIIII